MVATMKLWSLLGNSQKLDGGAMFGNAPRAVWEKWSPPDVQNRIALACRALLASPLNGRTVLFETGIGAFFAPELRERYGVVEPNHVLLESLRGSLLRITNQSKRSATLACRDQRLELGPGASAFVTDVNYADVTIELDGDGVRLNQPFGGVVSWDLIPKSALASITLMQGGSKLMNWCVGNAKTELRGNALLITKQNAGSVKIDPLMALFNANALMGKNPVAAGSSVYNDDEDESSIQEERKLTDDERYERGRQNYAREFLETD